MVQDEQEKWDIVIKPRSGLFRLDLEEVWLYRDLLVMYIRRDIVTFYKQTVLGPLWFVIQPLLTTVMFMFVFGGILPLERLPKMVGIITHFLIDYGNSHSKLLGGQQIQQSHESYPLSGGRHDIQYAFKKEKIKAPCYRKLYISWNIRYISTFPSVWGI